MKTDMHYGATPAIFKIARELRKNPTKNSFGSNYVKIKWVADFEDNTPHGFM